MTNPIQRAGNHLHRKIVVEGADSDVFALAQLVFESINVDDLAAVLSAFAHRTDAQGLAQVAKNHLTGRN